jgi:hypothetical protein
MLWNGAGVQGSGLNLGYPDAGDVYFLPGQASKVLYTKPNGDLDYGDADNIPVGNTREVPTSVDIGLWQTHEAQITLNPHAVTQTDVGLGNVDNVSEATIQSNMTATHVGLGNVDNVSEATIQSNMTATHVGLDNVANVDTTDADNINDGAVNAIPTLTQVGNWDSHIVLTNEHIDWEAASAGSIDLSNIATVSVGADGLCPNLSNNASTYLDGTGNYSVPASGGSSKGSFIHHGSDDLLIQAGAIADSTPIEWDFIEYNNTTLLIQGGLNNDYLEFQDAAAHLIHVDYMVTVVCEIGGNGAGGAADVGIAAEIDRGGGIAPFAQDAVMVYESGLTRMDTGPVLKRHTFTGSFVVDMPAPLVVGKSRYLRVIIGKSANNGPGPGTETRLSTINTAQTNAGPPNNGCACRIAIEYIT